MNENAISDLSVISTLIRDFVCLYMLEEILFTNIWLSKC